MGGKQWVASNGWQAMGGKQWVASNGWQAMGGKHEKQSPWFLPNEFLALH
ncbi:hypothetical protein JP0044_09760 [Helicobacter pylori]|nr:hypothetical protein JP0044_09760 [Helicobacter pylori]